MNRSEQINELAAALCKAQGAFDHAKKEVKNEFYRSKYADLAGCIDAAKIHLKENGLSVSQITDTHENGIILETILMHSSGQWISGKYPINPVKNDPQGLGSATTYARRYAFCAITGIASDDDDGNAASGVGQKKPEPAKDNVQPIKTVDDHRKEIDRASSMTELMAIWQLIPKQMRTALEVDKDRAKARIAQAEKEQSNVQAH